MEYTTSRTVRLATFTGALLLIAICAMGTYQYALAKTVSQQCSVLGYDDITTDSPFFNGTYGCVSLSKDGKTIVRDTLLVNKM
jgi:hypothetical protein